MILAICEGSSMAHSGGSRSARRRDRDRRHDLDRASRGRGVACGCPRGRGGMEHPFLLGFCRAIAEEAVATMRFNFSYIERGRRSPDTERVLRETWLAAFDAAKAAGDRPVLVGGKSLGGRIASMCVADGMPLPGSYSWATRCTRLAGPSESATSTSTGSRCQCSFCKGRPIRSPGPSSWRRSSTRSASGRR